LACGSVGARREFGFPSRTAARSRRPVGLLQGFSTRAWRDSIRDYRTYHEGMSTNQGPRGRLPRSVYIKRRLWVLAGLIAVIAIIVLLIWRPGSSSGAEEEPAKQTSQSQEKKSESTEKAADDEKKSSEPVPCTEDNVEVTAETDKDSYASGELPKL